MAVNGAAPTHMLDMMGQPIIRKVFIQTVDELRGFTEAR